MQDGRATRFAGRARLEGLIVVVIGVAISPAPRSIPSIVVSLVMIVIVVMSAPIVPAVVVVAASDQALDHPAQAARTALTFLAVAVEEVAECVEH